MFFIPLNNLNGEIEAAVSGLGLEITTFTIAVALLVFAAGVLTNKASNIMVTRAVDRRNGDDHAAKTAKKLTAYIIYPLTIVMVLGVFGLPLAHLGTALGLIGLGVSFALRDIIANFFSGILIMINKPFKINDQIEFEGFSGTVKDINIMATDVKTYDGRKIIVPNSTLYNDTVINNTAYDERRFDVLVGIGYDEDIELAKELALKALDDSEAVSEEHDSVVLVSELNDSSVDLKLRGWTRPSRSNLLGATSEVTQRVKEYYDEEGIDIPYPIRTVFMEGEQ